MGGVIIILTRGMGEWSTYGLPLSFLVGRLGGLCLDGRCSCTEDSFAGHSGLYCGDFLTVNIYYVLAGSQLAMHESRQRRKKKKISNHTCS